VAQGQTGSETPVERILRMVAEGRVTPEQASELLKALPRDEAAPGPEGPAWRWNGRTAGGANFVGIDLAELGRLGRQVATRVERELDGLERTAMRAWQDIDGDDDGVEPLLQSDAPASGRVELDVEMATAGLRLRIDPEATQVRVAYRTGEWRGLHPDPQVPKATWQGQTLRIEQCGPRRMILGSLLRMERVDVWLPPTVGVVGGTVRCHNAAVRIDGIALDRLEASSANGRVAVRAPRAGELRVESLNGRVDLDVTTASAVQAMARNGKVTVRGAIARLEAQTGNGRVQVWPVGLTQDAIWRVSSGNGALDVVAPAAPVGITARLRSGMGGIDVDVPDAAVRWQGRGRLGASAEVERSRGAGAAQLTLDAQTGNGRLRLRGEADAAGTDDDGEQAGA